MREQHSISHLQVHNSSVFKDIWDGKVIAENALFKISKTLRFCEIDRPTFVADPLAKGATRTVHSYKAPTDGRVNLCTCHFFWTDRLLKE
ncbi:hypothetical protein UPYG_G00140410 [Umbra pygmaea]|uniref:Uncharacterized protein n=1 Tax=Umbra pygmaea TaxID=75934 RepID=A0ABD0WVQ7_UMBPY